MSDKIVTIAGAQHELEIERDGSTIRSGDQRIDVLAVREDELEVRVDGRIHIVPFAIDGATVSFAWGGEIWFAEVVDKGARTRARHRDHSMSAPMPGVVLKILVAPGATVTKGAPLVVLEAMKMEHVIAAPRDGVISAINCAEGELVQPGEDLVTLDEE